MKNATYCRLLLWKAITAECIRHKEIFPVPAKTDTIDARRVLELFCQPEYLSMAKDARYYVTPAP
ncbi:hypothetical protein [Candidatus Nitrotoga sp. M5]|uniref:hypothetical protein n=1 Tax=Candidatus Nitrotoga sp. M5 TaxID=2890409 RepID=UPI001EF28EBF|nr:hypothetical protein [Candidatus Nitrotoga sp. M5]